MKHSRSIDGQMGWVVVFVITVVAILVVWFMTDNCEQKRCAAGLQPQLVHYRCLCVGADPQ